MFHNYVLLTGSKETLFSGGASRDSVDTWFEVDLPFKIEPDKICLKPKEKCKFKVTFCPMEAFDFKVRLTSSIGKHVSVTWPKPTNKYL